VSEPGALVCALQALKKQFIDFRFRYPLDVIRGSGTNTSLSYYLYSDKLSWSALRLDTDGIPQAWFRMTGKQYWPAYIAWYGLVNLGHYLHKQDEAALDVFLNQVNWLKKNAVVRSGRSVVWTMNFDYPVGSVTLRAPWVSAHAQGLCISALVRGWRITEDKSLLELLEGCSKVFMEDHREGGIRIPLREGALYTEVPGGPQPGIMDGFLTSLLGLHDLFVETGNQEVKQLFLDGIAGLKSWIHSWDFRGKWSWYGSHEYLCSPAHHCINRLLLQVLGEITADAELAAIADNWNLDRLNTVGRVQVYLLYNWTQSLSRIRYKTWQLRPARSGRALASESSCLGSPTTPGGSHSEVAAPAKEDSQQNKRP